jgi:hypothetical protein
MMNVKWSDERALFNPDHFMGNPMIPILPGLTYVIKVNTPISILEMQRIKDTWNKAFDEGKAPRLIVVNGDVEIYPLDYEGQSLTKMAKADGKIRHCDWCQSNYWADPRNFNCPKCGAPEER